MSVVERDEFGRDLKHPGNGSNPLRRRPPNDDYDRRRQDRNQEDRYERPNHRRHNDTRYERLDNNINNHDNRYNQGDMRQYEDDISPGLVVQGRVFRIEAYGAFLEFDDPRSKQQRRRLTGLIHISQMASHRVEQVTEIVNFNDTVYAVILSMERGGRQERIKLGLRDVDQMTGHYNGRSLDYHQEQSDNYRHHRHQGGRGGGARRAKERRELYMAFQPDWREGANALNKTANTPFYLRTLWSASPEPPSRTIEPPTNNNKKREPESESSGDPSSDDDSSVSLDSRRRDRKRSRDKSSRGKRRESSRRSKRRKRQYSSSSEDSSASSSSSSSSNSSSSSVSTKSLPTKKEIPDLQSNEAPQTWTESELKNAQDLKDSLQKEKEASSDEEGPMPLPQSNASGGAASQGMAVYGKALLPGEGQAIAQYVQQNLRIPRRGEIGYSGTDVEKFENSGFVMSGSRHKRMNAVRIRKENQVYSAEEQRALALITMEENQQKEAQLMEDFRVVLKEKQRLRNKEKT
jgi:predicted RNA-binding protein with RPS1 domain